MDRYRARAKAALQDALLAVQDAILQIDMNDPTDAVRSANNAKKLTDHASDNVGYWLTNTCRKSPE